MLFLHTIDRIHRIRSVVFSIISGLKAMIKCKERSILVFICVLIDVLAIYFAIAEFIGFITGSLD